MTRSLWLAILYKGLAFERLSRIPFCPGEWRVTFVRLCRGSRSSRAHGLKG
jgi:hypothetical protein